MVNILVARCADSSFVLGEHDFKDCRCLGDDGTGSDRSVVWHCPVVQVNILTSIDQMGEFEQGQVLVADMTDPDWEPIMLLGLVAFHQTAGVRAGVLIQLISSYW